MICANKRAGLGTFQNLADRFFDGLERLPIAARRKGIPALAIPFTFFRLPVARLDTLDEFGRDAVAFN